MLECVSQEKCKMKIYIIFFVRQQKIKPSCYLNSFKLDIQKYQEKADTFDNRDMFVNHRESLILGIT